MPKNSQLDDMLNRAFETKDWLSFMKLAKKKIARLKRGAEDGTKQQRVNAFNVLKKLEDTKFKRQVLHSKPVQPD